MDNRWKFGPLMGWHRFWKFKTPFVIDTPISSVTIQGFGISIRLSGRRAAFSWTWPTWTFHAGWRFKRDGVLETIQAWCRGHSLYISYYSTPWSAAYWKGRALYIGYEYGKWRFLPDAEKRSYRHNGVSYCESAFMGEEIDEFREVCQELRELGVESIPVATHWSDCYMVPLKAPKGEY